MQRRQLISAFLTAGLASQTARAQADKTLRILVGFPPGGSADIIARIVGDAIRDDFTSVVIENKPGAAGRIAMQQLKSAKPDGQTVIVMPSGPMVVFPHVYKNLGYDAVNDFSPISQLARFQFCITSGPASDVKTIAEMLAKAKADPKTATYGSSGLGTLPHFLGVMLEQSTGIALTHVPFQGGAPANTALLGGHIAYNIDVVTEALELRRAGKIRVLAVTGSQRDPLLPDVPTLREAGVAMEASAWFAMYGPAGMSPDTLARMERAVRSGLAKPAIRERLAKVGTEPIGSTALELAAAQRTDLARWEKPIKATGVTLD